MKHLLLLLLQHILLIYNAYQAPTPAIGPKQAGGSWSSLNHLFINTIPTLLRLEFVDVDPRITSIALLKIKAGRNDAQFRNISVEK